METEDLSQDLAQISIAFEVLGLNWESERVRTWVLKAGAWYLGYCKEQGITPVMPPPYPNLRWMPPILIKKLAVSMKKALEAEGYGNANSKPD